MAEYLLTEEEERKVQEGQAAATLLSDPAFLLAIERVRKECAERILTTAPQDQESRELNYHLSRGLTAVTEELAALEAEAASIIANAQLATSEDAPEEISSEDADFDY